MNEEKQNDLEYENYVIKEVIDDYIVTDLGSFFYRTADSPTSFQPVVGMVARFYGKGFGYAVRGLDIQGVEIFYKTKKEAEEEYRLTVTEAYNKQRMEFEEQKEELDKRFEALPVSFQKRIEKFRANNPDFRWKYEAYEMFCCEEALKIAAHCKNFEMLEAFQKADWEKQKEVVNDEHSRNTFGAACYLAALYLNDPEDIVKMHGALAPLVGSEEYGCVPKDGK